MIGQTIAHYKITAKLGEGGMGEVYLAEDLQIGRKVAIKFLSSDRTSELESRQRFIHEARAQAMLNHPNVATFYEVVEDQGRAFIVMEYIDGRPLHEFVSREKLSLGEILDLIIQIGEGLMAAHEQGVTHRDIKPDNILVTSKRRVKITDFGLARWKGASTLTQSGTRMGTAYYMSPEQAEGKKVDHRTDLFAMGIVLYELVCGQRPFAGETEASVLYELTNKTPAPLARFCRDVPAPLESIVSKCLAKHPDDRHQTAADLVTDLRSVRRSMTAGPSVMPARPMTARRRTRRVAVGAVAGVAAIAAVAALLWNPFGQTPEPVRAGRKMLVVLPFENLGPADQEYFADGMTEEITTRVAKMPGLGVISRTSAVHYKGQDMPLRDIGRELGVDYVLEGTIRWDQSASPPRVRINPQLIRVADDTHLWAETYDRVFREVFAVQSEIAGEVAEALNLSLASGSDSRTKPTDNLTAYDFYLRGKEYLENEKSASDLRTAIRMFEQAIALDSGYADPYGGIGMAQIALADQYHDSDALRDSAKQALDQSLVLDPNLEDVHFALGLYHNWTETAYDRALEAFERAEELGYKQGEVYREIGVVQMRQGRWREAMANMNNAITVDPRSTETLYHLVESNEIMRRYDKAMDWADRTVALEPDNLEKYHERAWICLLGYGYSSCAGRMISLSPDPANLRTVSAGLSSGSGDLYRSLWRFQLADISAQRVDLLDSAFDTEDDVRKVLFGKGQLFGLAGQMDSARYYYDSLITLLKSTTRKPPELWEDQSDLGLVCALAGYKDDAIKYASLGMETMPIATCHL